MFIFDTLIAVSVSREESSEMNFGIPETSSAIRLINDLAPGYLEEAYREPVFL